MTDGTPRRRRWSASRKRAIMAEALVPGVSVAAVAQRHEVNANLVFKWLREAGHGRRAPSKSMGLGDGDRFVSLGIVSDAAGSGGPLLELQAARPQQPERRREAGVIEIELTGARVRVDGAVETATLRRVLRVLKELA